MHLASISENKSIEKRLAITPEIVKKYISLGFNISLPNSYGVHLGFKDEDYNNLGVNLLDNEKEIIKNADIIIQLGLPDDEKLSLLKENQTLVGSLNTFSNKEKLENLKTKKINCFSLELLPRITRAQSMDILSSQANLAGYKAVIEAFQAYERAIPMMMTAAGTIPAAKVLVIGAGVFLKMRFHGGQFHVFVLFAWLCHATRKIKQFTNGFGCSGCWWIQQCSG